MTEECGAAWRQTIFLPFADMSNLGRGSVLRARVDAPVYSTKYYDPRDNSENVYPVENVPYLKFSAVHGAEGERVTLFALNRHLDEAMPLQVDLKGFAGITLEKAHQLHNGDLKAVNTAKSPETVKPTDLAAVKIDGDKLTVSLAPAFWNVIRLAAKPA